MTLALSASTDFFSLALFDSKNHLTGEMGFYSRQKLQQIGLDTLDLFLASCSCPLESLTGLAVDTGPGGFTSLRLGVAMMKTLAFSLNLPLRECSSLDLIAFHLENPKNLIVCLDGKQSRLYTRIYDEQGQKSEIMDLPPQALKNLIHEKNWPHFQTLGNGFESYPELKNPQCSFPDFYQVPTARNMARCWKEPLEQNRIQARYYRKTQAEEKKIENSSH